MACSFKSKTNICACDYDGLSRDINLGVRQLGILGLEEIGEKPSWTFEMVSNEIAKETMLENPIQITTCDCNAYI